MLAGLAAPLVAALAGRPRPAWLDLGCGVGRLARQLDDAGPPGVTVGVDLQREMLLAARPVHPALLPVLADAARLPFRDGAFDLVLASFMLHHVREQWRTLAEVYRVLRRDGLFAVATWGVVNSAGPAFDTFEECVAQAGAPDRDPAPPPNWNEAIDTEERLAALLADLGFAPERVWEEECAWTWTPASLVDYLGRLGGTARRLESLRIDRREACLAAALAALQRLPAPDLVWRPRVLFAVARKGAESENDTESEAGGR